jgi:hypothetical protein
VLGADCCVGSPIGSRLWSPGRDAGARVHGSGPKRGGGIRVSWCPHGVHEVTRIARSGPNRRSTARWGSPETPRMPLTCGSAPNPTRSHLTRAYRGLDAIRRPFGSEPRPGVPKRTPHAAIRPPENTATHPTPGQGWPTSGAPERRTTPQAVALSQPRGTPLRRPKPRPTPTKTTRETPPKSARPTPRPTPTNPPPERHQPPSPGRLTLTLPRTSPRAGGRPTSSAPAGDRPAGRSRRTSRS